MEGSGHAGNRESKPPTALRVRLLLLSETLT